MIFYNTKGELINLDRSNFISDEVYYKKIMELQYNFAKFYSKSVMYITNNTINTNNIINYDNTLGYTSDCDSDTD